jgi:hypothetical protein
MDDGDKTVARMHELVAKTRELLSELQPQEQAAVVYALARSPGIVEHLTSVITTSMKQELKVLAQTCQCPSCMAKRPKA